MTNIRRTISYRHVAGPYVGHTGAMNLGYDPARPFEVTVDFGPAGAWQIWRDILARRVDGKAECLVTDGSAEGGACCEVDGAWAYLTLAGAAGGRPRTVTLQFVAAELAAFLDATERLVPCGAEALDLDAGLDALLKDGAR